MKISSKMFVVAAALALAGAAGLVGCENSDPAAQSDWTLKVSANPADVTLGQNATGTSDILALVYDKGGTPKSGIGVRFSTSAGLLQSNGAIVETNARGEARDVLTTGGDATVTAISGSLNASVNVTVGGANSPPTAAITLSPSGTARKTVPVTFSGSQSEDTDGEIASYTWTLVSDNPDPGRDNPQVIETTNQAIVQSFVNAQRLDVTLRVTDNQGATGTDVDVLNIAVNIAPKAEAGPATNGTVSTNPSYRCSVQLSGAASVDLDGATCPACAIAAYEWNWGDGVINRFTNGQTIAQHTYFAPGAYTVTLFVWDNGEDGLCDVPSTTGDPRANCPTRLISPQDTTTVTCAAQ